LGILLLSVNGQVVPAIEIADAITVPKQKFDSYISKKNFAFIGTTYQTDTISREYNFRSTVKNKFKDSAQISIQRALTSFSTKEDFSFSYHTSSKNEYRQIRNELIKAGFYTNQANDTLLDKKVLYQSKDMTVFISFQQVDDTLGDYSFTARKQALPKPKEIEYAEDLIVFDSHEYLKFYFGDDHVRKDIYYLSDTKIGKCSVLFPNSNRQVVFLWGDEVNNRKLNKIYIGGQLMAEGSLEYDKNVAENIWRLRNGIHSGMSLYALRLLNDAAFNFNAGNSANSGMVFTDSTGKVDFKAEGIMLGCMNCNDNRYLRQKILNSDDAIAEERILFVHTIILDPAIIMASQKAPQSGDGLTQRK
jgi:hypothetical protein